MNQWFIFVALLLFVLPAGEGWGANARSELKGVKKEIQKKELLLKTTKKIEQQVSGELALIEKGLREKENNLKRLTLDLKALEQSLEITQRRARSTQVEVDRKQQDIRLRLVSLYKAGDIGPIRIFFSTGSFPQMLESLRYMQAVLESDQDMIDDYNSRIKELQALKVKLEEDARKKETLRVGIEVKKREIEVEKKRKADYLAKVRQDKGKYEASLKELAANASRLQDMIQKLEAKSRKRYTAKPSSPPAKGEPKEDKPATVPATGFGARKGQLSLPVKGTIVQGFGTHQHPEFRTSTVSNGLSITAPAGADIHAVESGSVIFAKPFKGYGNMVIIDHGDGFFSVYAHASRIAKKEGSSVTRNEVIASVGDADSSRGPMLYFEIRYQGRPVNPSLWFH